MKLVRFIKDYKMVRPDRKDKKLPMGTLLMLAGDTLKEALESGKAELANKPDHQARKSKINTEIKKHE